MAEQVRTRRDQGGSELLGGVYDGYGREDSGPCGDDRRSYDGFGESWRGGYGGDYGQHGPGTMRVSTAVAARSPIPAPISAPMRICATA